MYRFTFSILVVFVFIFPSFAQSKLLFNKWKLVEIYELDTMQTLLAKSELSASAHREMLNFNFKENGIEQSYMRIMPDSTVFYIEKKLDNDIKLKKPLNIKITEQQITFFKPYIEVQIVANTASLLILGRAKTTLEVYVPETVDMVEAGYDDYYIWEYINKFFPHKFKIIDGGATSITKQN